MIEIVCFTATSGLTDYSISLARALGYAARVVTAHGLPDRFKQLGFEVVQPFRRSRHYPVDLFRFMWGTLKRRPACSLWQGPLKFPVLDGLAARFLRWRGVRCAVTVHDVLPHYPKPWSRLTYGFYYRSFEKVIVHSQDAQIGVQGLGVSAPTLIVPHGVYDLFRLTELSRDEARDRLSRIGARPKGTLVLFFGHLESRKGLFEFLRVAERMKSEEDFSFMVSGASSLTAEERRVLHSAVDALGNVILHERRIPFEEVELHFNACDIVALPYLEGTTSGVLKLAVAFSRPVIATAVGDFPEQVTGRAGVCIPPGDRVVDDFEQALRDMRSNLPQWQTQIEATARDLSWSGIGRRIQDFLQASADA